MTFDEGVPPPRSVRHYYGDTSRIMFFIVALLTIVATTTGAELPLAPMHAVAWAIVLAVAAGITNPEQKWIHWINEIIAALGTLIFTLSAIGHWQTDSILDRSYLFTEVIALLSLVSLYFTTKTIRGLMLRPNLG